MRAAGSPAGLAPDVAAEEHNGSPLAPRWIRVARWGAGPLDGHDPVPTVRVDSTRGRPIEVGTHELGVDDAEELGRRLLAAAAWARREPETI